jgi:AbrB family looped-hinge helix DNA binding protein
MLSKRYEVEKIECLSKVYQKGKTQIPADVRKDLKIKDGDKILWIRYGEKWLICKS